MESPEQMDESSEQSKEESVKDSEGTPEKTETPESYDVVAWDKLKQGGAAFAISKGKEIGVPQEELDRFAQDVIAREIEDKNYGLVYRFRKNIGIGTEEDVRAAGEQAYKFFLESRDLSSAVSIAEDIYGRDSEEYRRAYKDNEAEQKKTKDKRKKKEAEIEDEEQELNVILSKDATFSDLLNAIDFIEKEKGLGELHFEEELWDNFDSEIVEEILSFRDIQASKAATTKFMDFFKERGYSQSDVSKFLPIRFKREQKKKE